MVDYVIEIPRVDERLIPLVVSLPLQMLAYHIAVNKTATWTGHATSPNP